MTDGPVVSLKSFFEEARAGRLTGIRCECGEIAIPPKELCAACGKPARRCQPRPMTWPRRTKMAPTMGLGDVVPKPRRANCNAWRMNCSSWFTGTFGVVARTPLFDFAAALESNNGFKLNAAPLPCFQRDARQLKF